MLSIEEPLEVGPETLKHKIDSGEEFVLLDVRTPWEYDAWSINYAGVKPLLLPVQDLFSQPEAVLEKIPLNKEVLIVCAHGNRSLFAAQILNSLGYRAKSVRGGMNLLNTLCDTAEIHIDPELVILQIRRIVKGCVSYILASRETGEAVIVDPQHLAHASYTEEVKKLGLRVVAVVETHRPLDHISGGYKLSETLKSPLYTFSTPNPNPDARTIRLGSYTLESVILNQHLNSTILLLSKPGSKAPAAVLAGDLLFTDGYARPDTLGAANLEEMVKALYQLYDCLFENTSAEAVVLPSHCAPQSIRKSTPIQATLGEVKARLWCPKPKPDELLDFLLKHLPQKPANHEIIAQINTYPHKYLTIADERQLRDMESGENNMAVRKHRSP